jgi:hypothetical protein
MRRTRCAAPATGPHPFRPECGEQLAEQERVAAGDLVAHLAELALGIRGGEALADDRFGRLGGERRGPHDAHRFLEREPLDERARGGRGDLPGAQARQYDQARSLEPRDEVGEEPQRGQVAPVQVVDRDHQRREARQIGCEPVQPVQRREFGRRDAALRG